jgi:hypothetical protein
MREGEREGIFSLVCFKRGEVRGQTVRRTFRHVHVNRHEPKHEPNLGRAEIPESESNSPQEHISIGLCVGLCARTLI